MIYSLCGAPFILCYFFISSHVMKSYTYFQRMAAPIPPSHLPPCVISHSFNIHFTYLHIILFSWRAPARGISQYHTILCVCQQEAVHTHRGHPWWLWRLFLGCVSAGKAGSGAGPACSEGGLCLLGFVLRPEHVTHSCTEGSKGSWEGFHKAATEHICSGLLFFGVKQKFGIFLIVPSRSRKNLMESGVSLGMSIQYCADRSKFILPVAWASCLWRGSYVAVFRSHGFCFESTLLLFGCTTGRVTLPLMKSCKKKGWSRSSVSQRYQKRGCVCSQSHLSCGSTLPQSGCFNNIFKIM